MKQIPKFKNEDEEREFWTTHDSTEYLDWLKAKKLDGRKRKSSPGSPSPSIDTD